jgi:hypothetical protein
LLVVALYCTTGCGGTKIKDYDEAVPIPDIPLAGGGGADTKAANDDIVPSSAAQATDTGTAAPAGKIEPPVARRPTSEELRPTKSVEFD